jgi:hypothetical protein
MGCPEDRYKRASRRDSRRLHDDFLPRTGRSTGDSGISGDARSVLACLLFGHDQGADETPVFRRPAAGWDGCCAKSREAVVIVFMVA